MKATGTPSIFGGPRPLWSQNREATRNWLALGLLLAAWNAAERNDDAAARQRPPSLRACPVVSVRMAQRF